MLELEKINELVSVGTSTATLKIVLKTKNDFYFIDRWVEHHAKIVGHENIIIIDNGSDEEKMLAYYENIKNKCLILSYGGFHNDLHRPFKVPALYEYLEKTTKYMLFLDTDEFAEFYDSDGRKVESKKAIDQLDNAKDELIFGKWLLGTLRANNKYYLREDPNDVNSGMRSGKPIIKPNKNIADIINHNFQAVKEYDSFSSSFNYLFIKHLKFEDFTQRVNMNFQKLIKYNSFKEHPQVKSVEDVLTLDSKEFAKGNKRNWISEIQKLKKISKDGGRIDKDYIEDEDSGILFSNDLVKERFSKFFEEEYVRGYFEK